MDKLTNIQELERLFYDLVIRDKELNIIDGEHVSIDSIKLDSYYNKRTSVERCNSRLKKYLNLDNVIFKGIKKVKIHVLLNCITLIAGTIAVNLGKSLNKAA